MSEQETLLSVINDYYMTNRQVGHTTASLDGAKTRGAILAVASRQAADDISRHFNYKNIVVASDPSFLKRQLKGKTAPLVVDNAVWHSMAEEEENK